MMKSVSLRKDVLSVGTANAIDYALQFVVPIVVARALFPEDFAGYRMVWLVVGTVMAFATLQIPQSLSYFLPRLHAKEKASYITGAVYILVLFGTISSVTVNPWYPLLPVEWVRIDGPLWFYSVFILFWIVSSLLDWLPVSDGRAQWQARVVVLLSAVRVISVSSVAWIIGSLEAVLFTLIVFVLIKLSLLLYYINQYHAWRTSTGTLTAMRRELSYTWSFGLASGLYVMRQQIELWLVVALFSAREFASFSLGSVAAPLFGLIRRSVNNVVFPNLSEMELKDNKEGIAKLNCKATSVVAYVLVPLAVFLWVFSEEIIVILYTGNYSDASDVMRVYLLGVIPQIMESSTLLRVSGLGRSALHINLLAVPVVVFVSYVGIQTIGLLGGALGSVVAVYLSHFLAVKKGALSLGIPIRNLYDMRSLSLILISGLVAGVCAWYSTTFVEDFGSVTVLSTGATVGLIVYVSASAFTRAVPHPIINFITSR